MTQVTIDEQMIAEAAFYLWLEEGRPEGRADDHWSRARAALEGAKPRARRTTARKPAAKPAARKAAAATAETGKTTAKAPAKRSRKAATPKA